IGGYLLGSIPIAWIVTRLVTGEDLRSLGSGNVGVMNVALSTTRWAGLVVLVGEAAKGLLAVILARRVSDSPLAIGITVLAAVIGTRWMVWLGFAGGRGNTAGLAAMALLSWQTLLIGIGIWALLRLITRSSFWATRISLVSWPFVFGWLTQSWIYLIFGLVLSGIYLTTHRTVSDDHTIIKERWPSLWAFLTGPKRERPS
ncbi:MAG TPA: glycerol-3-phosphate acyltransferase, partial [Anaerolineales bacterium]|nr:glycerol-3-phosphate acyltransferase [Anaerolineales bacterium]